VEEIVHIIPLSFEIDRAVKPFENMRANRAYLVYSRKLKGKNIVPDASYFIKAVKRKLEQLNIEVIIVESNLSDPLPLLSTISNLINREKKAKNLIYVNMSASGKLTAVSATLAAMYHDVKVYYVNTDGGYARDENEVQKHGLSIVNDPKCSILTNFTIDIPSGAKSTFLTELYKKGKMTMKDIIQLIKENKLQGFDDLNESINGRQRSQNNLLVRINRGLLDELKLNGYIQIEKKGRSKVITITDKGIYAACLIGTVTG